MHFFRVKLKTSFKVFLYLFLIFWLSLSSSHFQSIRLEILETEIKVEILETAKIIETKITEIETETAEILEREINKSILHLVFYFNLKNM